MKEIWQTGEKKNTWEIEDFKSSFAQTAGLTFPAHQCSRHLLVHVPWNSGRTKGWAPGGVEPGEALEILCGFLGWSWNRFMRTEPKNRVRSMSRHPWSQFSVGFNIAGFCQVQCKFIISSLETGFPLIPNWLIHFSSLRPSYCPQAKGETISLWEFTWG